MPQPVCKLHFLMRLVIVMNKASHESDNDRGLRCSNVGREKRNRTKEKLRHTG